MPPADIIDLGARRECTEAAPRFYNSEHYAQVHEFTPAIAMCGRCGSSSHRAHRCPLNKKSPRDHLKQD